MAIIGNIPYFLTNPYRQNMLFSLGRSFSCSLIFGYLQTQMERGLNMFELLEGLSNKWQLVCNQSSFKPSYMHQFHLGHLLNGVIHQVFRLFSGMQMDHFIKVPWLLPAQDPCSVAIRPKGNEAFRIWRVVYMKWSNPQFVHFNPFLTVSFRSFWQLW